MHQGLTSSEAEHQLKLFGYNELPKSDSKNIFVIAKEVMKEPMFLLLISCAFIYVFLGDYKEGLTMLVATLVIIIITFYQYQKTERALEALKNMSSPRALVIRDGKEIRIPGREVVPNDLMLLNEGDRVAADAEIIYAHSLMVDESMLTGESQAVSKQNYAKQGNKEGLVYAGTLIVKGRGKAKVIATGATSDLGKIGSSLTTITQNETQLQLELKKLIKKLFLIGGLLSIGVVIAFYLTRGNFVKSLLTGLSTSMAILPEEFPVVLTVFLAIGAWRLSKKKVLARKSSSIETLGSTTILCVDKTGTLTQNKMEIAALYNGEEMVHSAEFECSKEKIHSMIYAAQMASPKNSIDPMEKAIASIHSIVDLNEGIADAKLVKEYPLSNLLPCITHVYEKKGVDSLSVYIKGAPETILDLCVLDEEEKHKHRMVLHQMAKNAYRVIAVGGTQIKKEELPITQDAFTFQFKGLIAFEDPIRPEVPAAIEECRTAGIKIIMITGDFPVTAEAIALKIGLPSKQVNTGEELDQLTNAAFSERISNINVYACVLPAQKLRIVEALKQKKEVVAMTGDGVNDAPALKAAHIGIAMGARGTDVAREASSLVLVDDNFASIVAAIRMGRKIYDNLQKAMSYILAIHIPIILLTLLPALFPTIPLLLMPLHIVFLELIIDPISSVAFESEKEEEGIMSNPPRNPREKFFGTSRLLISIGKGVLLTMMIMIVYVASVNEGHTENEIRTITYTALIIGNLFLILTSLSNTRNIIAVILSKNYSSIFIILSSLMVLMIIINLPATQLLFSFDNPGFGHFAIILVSVFAFITFLEIFKLFKYKK